VAKWRDWQMKDKTWTWVTLILRWIVALVFIYAGVGKILNPTGFAENIDNYRMLPYFLVTIMAAILPWLEVLCGLLLIFGKWLKGASLIVIAMNAVFIVAITSALLRGLDINCGCFSLAADSAKVGIMRLLEDVGLLIAGVIIYRRGIMD